MLMIKYSYILFNTYHITGQSPLHPRIILSLADRIPIRTSHCDF